MIEFDLGAVIIGMVLGIVLIGLAAWYEVKRFEYKLERMINTAIKDTMFGLEVEQHQGVFFCYSAQDRQFVCQGADLEQIRSAFRQRYPDRIAYITGGDPTAVQQLQAQIAQQESNENSPSI
jgi:hypothetical protein